MVEPIVIDTRQKYFHVSTAFLDKGSLPKTIYVYHPAFKRDDKGIATILYAHGYQPDQISPIMDEYNLEYNLPVTPIIPPPSTPTGVYVDVREKYDANKKVTKADVKNVFHKIGSPFEKLWQNILYKIGAFLLICLILYLLITWLIKWLTTPKQNVTVTTPPPPPATTTPTPPPPATTTTGSTEPTG